jgi:HEAT repeat protein
MHAMTCRARWPLASAIALGVLVTASLAAGQQTVAAATAVLEQALRDPAAAPRRAAFAALADYRCRSGQVNEACLTLLATAASHDDWIIRLTALPYAVRADLPAERCRPALHTAAVRDPNEPVRRAAAKLLADRAVNEDREVLVTLLNAPDPLLRELAAGGLARLGDQRQVDALRNGLHDDDPELALEAARLLSSLDSQRAGDADAVLRVALAHRDEVVRANAIYTLSEMRAPAWSETEATRALDDPSPLVRSAALTALADVRVNDGPATWALASLARRWGAERTAELRLEILNALGELEHRRIIPPSDVVRFAQFAARHDADRRLRLAAEGLLAEHDAAAATRLSASAGDPARDVTERLLALSVLGRSCQADALATLARLLDEPGGAAVDRDALRVGAAAAWLRLAAALEDRRCEGRTRAA